MSQTPIVDRENATNGSTVTTNGTVFRRRIVDQPVPTQPTTSAPTWNMDRARWGPIWAGFVSTIGLFLLIESFLVWIGALGLSVTGGTVSMNHPWVLWIVAVVSFFLGGVVMAMTSPVRGVFANGLNGFFVWALATTLIAAGSVLGAGVVFGTIGAMVAGVVHVSSHTTVTPSDVSNLKSSAGWAFWTLLSTAVAVALGGFIAGMARPVGWVDDANDSNPNR